MEVPFAKYHALGNDFIVISRTTTVLGSIRLSQLAQAICDRHTGVGADGIIYLSSARGVDARLDIYNADGSWAEKSGNGLRIAAVHLALGQKDKRRRFAFLTGDGINSVTLKRRIAKGYMATSDLGEPSFDAASVPVRTRKRSMINQPLHIGGVKLPVTCLSVGNPHTVLVVDNFDFDWPRLGAEIETAKQFPHGTNVEFVKQLNRHKLRVAEWERGAGTTGSSGTGAAAAVCALVIQGLAERACEVVFETGSLFVEWQEDGNLRLKGPAQQIAVGQYLFR